MTRCPFCEAPTVDECAYDRLPAHGYGWVLGLVPRPSECLVVGQLSLEEAE